MIIQTATIESTTAVTGPKLDSNMFGKMRDFAADVITALVDGNDALHTYEHLRAKGATHDEAAKNIWPSYKSQQ